MVWNTVKTTVKVGCLFHVIFEHVTDVVWCRGPSMEPTIWSDNVVLCDHITPRYRGIRTGDIVISKSVTKPDVNVCKRVKGVPGDYIVTGYSFLRVPTGHVWLEGDNKQNSTDSRTYGPVPQALLRGRVVCRIWPLTEFRVFSNVD
ncbi:unnamed protein product [Nesidiocoris tenuis]|uniref:Inner membrane protease subunit n=2 Tax=Nesidiocoris tenuis TaxID=355587 RepID=A0ABN7AQJ7_9HEMI|nr:Inner membrane protease subunit [Nesidiocoris tenuis]CAB0006412.1 unnamed protein product [Nesidiocoris tenuis]